MGCRTPGTYLNTITAMVHLRVQSHLRDAQSMVRALLPLLVQVDNREVVVEVTDVKQTVYIYSCQGSTIQVWCTILTASVPACAVFGELGVTCTWHCIASWLCTVSSCIHVVQIKGKLNAITLDQCTKCGLVFESVVAACEVVNSRSVQVPACPERTLSRVPLHACGSQRQSRTQQ